MKKMDKLLDVLQWLFSAVCSTPSSGEPSGRPGQDPLLDMEQNWSALVCFRIWFLIHPLQVFGMGEAACHLPRIWRARPHFCTEWQLKVSLEEEKNNKIAIVLQLIIFVIPGASLGG